MYLFPDGGSKKYWKSHDFRYKNKNKERAKNARLSLFNSKRVAVENGKDEQGFPLYKPVVVVDTDDVFTNMEVRFSSWMWESHDEWRYKK